MTSLLTTFSPHDVWAMSSWGLSLGKTLWCLIVGVNFWSLAESYLIPFDFVMLQVEVPTKQYFFKLEKHNIHDCFAVKLVPTRRISMRKLINKLVMVMDQPSSTNVRNNHPNLIIEMQVTERWRSCCTFCNRNCNISVFVGPQKLAAIEVWVLIKATAISWRSSQT